MGKLTSPHNQEFAKPLLVTTGYNTVRQLMQKPAQACTPVLKCFAEASVRQDLYQHISPEYFTEHSGIPTVYSAYRPAI